MCGKNKAPFLTRGEISKDLSQVGPGKPVGYDNLCLLENFSGDDIAALRKKLESKGLKTLMLKGADCAMRSGALYAYDEQALTSLLRQRAHILKENGWPSEPEAFVRRLAIEWAAEKTLLFDTIADTFNNKAHPGRTDVKVPDRHEHFSPQYLACLKEREKNPGSGRACTPP